MIQNPILPGFCPDPSILRVGDDYYVAVSTFEWWPGVRLYHSGDLEHFRQLPSPLNRISQLDMEGNPDSCGVWAPDITYDGAYYWLIYTDVKTRNGGWFNTHNYLVKTKDIRSGCWSEPVSINSTGFDPSMLHDNDGRKYVVNMINGFRGILVQEYDPVKECLVGRAVNVFPGTGRNFTEGPHIYHIGEYYYLLMAEGGTAYEHCVTMARSRSLWGPYEEDPGNPVLTSDREHPEELQKCGHGDLVCTRNGEWYMTHLASRPPKGTKLSVLGRETCIQKMYWNEEGWLRLAGGGRFGRRETASPEGLKSEIFSGKEIRDDFDEEKLGLGYSSLRIPWEDFISLKERPGYLRIYGQESLNSTFRVSLVGRKQEQMECTAEVCMEFNPMCREQAAGLAYMYDTRNFYLWVKSADDDGREVLRLFRSDRGDIREVGEPVYLPVEMRNRPVYFRAEVTDDSLRVHFCWSRDGRCWTEMAEVLTDILTDEYCVGFTGAHFGMYCHDMTGRRCHVDFDYFELR